MYKSVEKISFLKKIIIKILKYFKGTVECGRFHEYPHMSIYYGNYKGMLNSSLSSFPVGTYAEIFCNHGNETVELILTCQENGNENNLAIIYIRKLLDSLFLKDIGMVSCLMHVLILNLNQMR